MISLIKVSDSGLLGSLVGFKGVARLEACGSDKRPLPNRAILSNSSQDQVYTTGVYLLDFFCSSFQFYLLLSPYLCFISLLYLDLYVLGDDALIRFGSFTQTKHLCVLIHI